MKKNIRSAIGKPQETFDHIREDDGDGEDDEKKTTIVPIKAYYSITHSLTHSWS
jgi:hypothetical protein